MANARLQVPPNARRGEAIEVRLLIEHPMETGFRRDAYGRTYPKNVVNSLVCRLAGAEVFRAELGSGIAANPYIAFWIVASASGELTVDWIDDSGVRGAVSAALVVS
jgi:sulfur-oxidizing protein SoxZ